MSKKYVYLFQEGKASMRDLLGGKGANLAEMTQIGLPVPPGFTITTEACNEYYSNGETLPDGVWEGVWPALAEVEAATGKLFGDPKNPLLVSVRSGAKFSMPGMMDTVLNLGLNDETVVALAENTQNERFAWDCYRRFIQMFGDVVLEVEHYIFEQILETAKEKQGVHYDSELSAESLKWMVSEYKKKIQRKTGNPFPMDPRTQLEQAVLAVFRSWNNDRANVYRRINNIPNDIGTAVNVQSMVFGNMGSDSGTGVAFTRNPSTGESALYGEYLMNAQGEDVVAGIRTPNPIATLAQENLEIYNQFVEASQRLESHYRDMQDIEFTIERGKLYMLQTRNGKRTASAAIRVAVELFHEGVITKEEAVMRIEPDQLEHLLHRRMDTDSKLQVLAKGLPASPGAASGRIVLSAEEAERLGNLGEKVILVRTETTPDDIRGILAAQGILTSRGGMTSHAAVVSRHMGKPAVCGCDALKIDYTQGLFVINGVDYPQGTIISIDGSTGRVIKGEVSMVDPELSEGFKEFLGWADDIARLRVMANADSPTEATNARDFGAVGIGLTRTEHMFMDPERIPIVQEMILAQSLEDREAALAKLLPMQEEDFYGILKAMQGFSVTIRLLDPPLHEFLPHSEELVVEITKLRISKTDLTSLHEKEALLRNVRALSELNPMLGHRGCRLGVSFPEITVMQARAIFQASARLIKEGYDIHPEVMIPLIMGKEEFLMMRKLVDDTAAEVMQEQNVQLHYKVGTMIEVPRAALLADEIGKVADFFSFGTNDLTQMTMGLSRDDAQGKFLPVYLDKKIMKTDPFVVLDREGVGKLIGIGVNLGRSTNSALGLGICGEHGGEPNSVEFCHMVGLDYVSCSPFRVPIARLAAAQAAVINKDRSK
ncbi:pyruvate, phosphate dikinase [Desulfosporosinus sp. BICA1-9]|uniref:pyruvate, phosphate dikinase n=1 Tax=Desulfosporosinus sp. BICA1-9 TaxID=1531958 RepID=UPI00054C7F8D|nr:pyruvate, phosphate dikinase [Desulfosporosinus sp. BICA1-9]KJS46572.1 MAG: pyruvate phosphate dikinase [Peptococcaceae bacterium BRH_c23]KJS86812.1 MAG: pyruvate phosphate dikinase [Desulfosporosinus sp. BICA1-9]HBW37864.1 pyruvate, phosphate dikinase [Desulfosporosinus sp.]